ncbi:MAG: hypothetical protein ACOCP4_02765 [Candidatus Woesearchaeota archaeon]
MKNYNCKYLEIVTDIYPRQVGENEFVPEQVLLDEVCWGRPDSPLHHGSYDCEGCPYFEPLKEYKNERE